MPYKKEHSARFNDPEKYTRIRRVNNEFGKGIDVLYGILPASEKGPRGGRTEIQAIRFDAKEFSEAEAKKKAEGFAKDKDVKIKKFEPAVVKESKFEECVKEILSQ